MKTPLPTVEDSVNDTDILIKYAVSCERFRIAKNLSSAIINKAPDSLTVKEIFDCCEPDELLAPKEQLMETKKNIKTCEICGYKITGWTDIDIVKHARCLQEIGYYIPGVNAPRK